MVYLLKTGRVEIFWIAGEPVAYAKPAVTVVNGIPRMYHRDPKGKFKAWSEAVKIHVKRAMLKHDIAPFPDGGAVALGCTVWLPKAKSNRKPTPTQKPDYDNLKYVPTNALKNLLWWDDDDILGELPGFKFWADSDHEPGMLLYAQEVTPVEARKLCRDLATLKSVAR